MAKGKSIFMEYICPETNNRLKTSTYNKTKHKLVDLAKRMYSKFARKHVVAVPKEIKRSK
jgi:hypothetical protein